MPMRILRMLSRKKRRIRTQDTAIITRMPRMTPNPRPRRKLTIIIRWMTI